MALKEDHLPGKILGPEFRQFHLQFLAICHKPYAIGSSLLSYGGRLAWLMPKEMRAYGIWLIADSTNKEGPDCLDHMLSAIRHMLFGGELRPHG